LRAPVFFNDKLCNLALNLRIKFPWMLVLKKVFGHFLHWKIFSHLLIWKIIVCVKQPWRKTERFAYQTRVQKRSLKAMETLRRENNIQITSSMALKFKKNIKLCKFTLTFVFLLKTFSDKRLIEFLTDR
jgi:hypothetical protein